MGGAKSPTFLDVDDRVHDDVRQVLVHQPVHDLTPVALTVHHARGLEHPQVLADQRLRHAERFDQLVHAPLRLLQLQDDGDPHRSGERAQQLTGRRQRQGRPRRSG